MRRHSALVALVLACSCSALVEIDDDKNLVGQGDGDGDASGDGDGDGEGGDGEGDGTGGGGDGDGDGGNPSGGGGMGGSGDGGSGASGDGGSGATGTGGAPGGTGGLLIEIPPPNHYYPLDGNTDDEGFEAPIPATVTGNATWYPTAGLEGGSLELPQNANASISFGTLVAGESPFTISWWFIQAHETFIALLTRFSTQSSSGFELAVDPSSPRMRIGGEEVFFTADFPEASEGRWTHVAIGYREMASGSQDAVRVWVNGESVLDELRVFTQSALGVDGELRIGQSGNGTQPFSGHLDEIRVYHSLLDDAEVQALYLYDAPPAP